MKIDFRDKVAIITGSSMGIGKAIATELVKRGATVILNGRNKDRLNDTEEELRQMGGTVSSVCCDITNKDEAKLLIQHAIDNYGKLDIHINNAGVSMRGNLGDLNPEVFKTVFGINVLGVANTTIPALSHIRKTNGSIVFISSVVGIRGLPGISAYSASKMALRALAESIRIEEAQNNIHVGLINVGYTEVDPNKKVIGSDGQEITISDRSRYKTQTVEEVANEVMRNIAKRKFITTLSTLGKLNAILQRLWPRLVEIILIRSINKFEERS